MEIIQNDIVPFKTKSCIALGNFDGIHLGHKKLITECVEYAKQEGLCSVIYTFQSHPSAFFGANVKLITSNEEKRIILENLGCDYVYLENFENVVSLSPMEFCDEILIKKLNAGVVFCGKNYTFGKNAQGNSDMLKSILAEKNVDVRVIQHVTKDSNTVSSTSIRQNIENGHIRKAYELLGHPYTISGQVLHGKKIGRTLGYPTINMDIPDDKIVPKFGVYFTVTKIDGKMFYSVSNVGKRPTLDANTDNREHINCETHIINHIGDDYGKEAIIYFIARIRDEMKFDDVSHLKSAISKDLSSALEMSLKFDKDSILCM